MNRTLFSSSQTRRNAYFQINECQMKRRNFLRATSILPFLVRPILGKGSGTLPCQRQTLPNSPVAAGKPESMDEAQRDFFYKPAGAWAADFIPFYADGEFQLFFLLDWRDVDKHGEGTPWYRISTRDFVHFTEHGEMLPRGTKEEQDLYVFTGSAIRAQEKYHIFYTGHNPHLQEKGKPLEGIMHAVSGDMKAWKKLPEQTFFAPSGGLEMNDWRDPFVFWNEESHEYNMLVAARFKKGIPRRRGLTAICTSKDLVKWETGESFYAPGLYYTHECPDLFKMGDWWYLLFSEFTDQTKTRYRMSRSLKGPWIIPARDDFDGHAFYAAKTASDGHKRFLFGWNPTRSEAKDSGDWNWGGNLVVHEIHQESNGELSVRVPDTVRAAFAKRTQLVFIPGTDGVRVENGIVRISSPGTFGAGTAGKMPATCLIGATIEFEKGTRECGLMLRVSEDLESAYYLRLEPHKNRLVFDKWPRDHSEVTQMVELDRGIELQAGSPVHFQVFIEGNKGVAYLNDKIAMNFRAYDLPEGNWGVFVTDGTASFKNMGVSTL